MKPKLYFQNGSWDFISNNTTPISLFMSAYWWCKFQNCPQGFSVNHAGQYIPTILTHLPS